MLRIKSFLFVLLLAITLVNCKTEIKQQRPNIIFIMADDLGYGDIEPFGQKLIETPHLSRMANEGMKFTNHYAGTSVCAPSRCSLITGMHTGRTEVRGNLQAPDGGQMPISDEAVTVGELLQSAGYTTGMVGKWGLGNYGTTGDPNKQGFDFFYGYTDQVLAHNHFPEYLLRNGEKEFLNNKVTYLDSGAWHKGLGSFTTEKKDFADDLFTNEALTFISDNAGNPFFLYLPYIIPHDNGEAPDDSRFEAPDQRQYTSKDWSKNEKDYAASISYLDDYVGKILNHLTKLKLEKNTLVIFTSDNGPYTDKMRFNSSGGLRGIKRDLYEGGSKVPFIAWWPGTIKEGTSSDHISAFWDFMPTVCELGGVTQPYESDGISYLPALLGKTGQKNHDYLYFEFHEQGGSQAVRQGKWKAVLLNVKTPNPRAMELYDLDKDPAEANNIADQHPEKVKEMIDLMEKAHRPSPLFLFPGEQ